MCQWITCVREHWEIFAPVKNNQTDERKSKSLIHDSHSDTCDFSKVSLAFSDYLAEDNQSFKEISFSLMERMNG